MKVLIIEDTIITRVVFEQHARDLGHEVTACAYAETALEAYQQTFYPLILIDLTLPGMDGFEFCRRIRALPSGDRSMILVITANDMPESIQAAIDAGADDYVVKPIGKDMLKLRLMVLERQYQNLIRRKQAEEELQNLRTAVETMPLGLTITDLQGKILYTNCADADMHGYQVIELLNRDVRIFAPPELWNPVSLEDMKHWKGLTRESINIRKNGSRFPVYLISEIVKDAHDEPYAIVTSCEEITDRKQTEEELRASHEQLRNLSLHLEAVREEERTTVARTIHDELGQILTALKFDIVWLKKRLTEYPATLREKAEVMENLIDTTLRTVKEIASQLRPGLLDDLGLSAAIEWQADEFQRRTDIPCDARCHPDEIIVSEAISTAVFRIFQETLTNAARHAGATHITVTLTESTERLVLTVSDNGRGITPEQIANPSAFGLIGIRERVRFLGGDVTFHGIPEQGTTVTVDIPFVSNDKD